MIRRRRYMRCACGAKGDLKNPRSVYGWIVAPHEKVKCGRCVEEQVSGATCQVSGATCQVPGNGGGRARVGIASG